MAAVVVPITKPERDNVIKFSVVKGKYAKEEVHYNKDGSISKRHPNKAAGKSSEVYPFTSEEEIKAMIKVFNNRIEEAPDEDKRWIAARNKMLFLIGINIGIRASDLCDIKWNFFLNEDGAFKDSYSLQPKKTKKTGKFVKLYFNDAIKKAITDYLEEYPMEDMNDYVFKSREGDSHITSIHLGKIIKDTAKEAGIERNICSHSLRKTFGYHVWHNAKDKEKALIMLMTIFNHSSVIMTKKYIGLMDEEIEDVFNGLNLGLDFLDK